MSLAVVVVGVLPVIFALVTWLYKAAKFRQQINKLSGPPTVPLLGNAHQMTSGPEWYKQVMQWGQTYRELGIFKLWLAFKPVLGVTRAETAEVLLNSSKHIDKSSEYAFLYPWLGTGLLTSTGEKWRSRRKMLTPTFHFRILQDFLMVFNSQTLVLLQKLQQKAGRGPFNIFPDITLCALDIICETAMGLHVSAQTKESEYVRAVSRICGLLEKRMRTPWHWNKALYNILGQGREHDECLRILHEFTLKVIKDRQRGFDSKKAEEVLGWLKFDDAQSGKKRLAFLDMLLYMSVSGQTLSTDDIKEEVDTFMFEGHDTTAAAVNWAIYLIGSDPNVQANVHKELDAVFGDSKRMPTDEDLKNMKYLECCIKEALRLYPSVPLFGRTTTEEVRIGSYSVPKGVTILVMVSSLHRDERWFPDPDVFKPERFLPENCTNRHPFAYIPFSAGLRNCIGQKFALMEEKVVLSTIFRNFHVSAVQKREDLKPLGELILRPQDGIIVELNPR